MKLGITKQSSVDVRIDGMPVLFISNEYHSTEKKGDEIRDQGP